MITVVNYGAGNIGAVLNMLRHIGVQAHVAVDARGVLAAEKIILPGVGAFDTAMQCIHALDGLRAALDAKALVERVPVLGICLGMQLLTDGSEEGILPGLGWIPGRARRFYSGPDCTLKVPHMGWNRVYTCRPHSLTDALPDEPRFYFVHSYYVKAADEADVLATTSYGTSFHSMLARDNIFGAQFHPEKSHRYGLALLKAFANL